LQQRRDFEGRVATNKHASNDTSILDEVIFLMAASEHNWGLPFQSTTWETPTLSYQEKRNFLVSAGHIAQKQNSRDNRQKPVTRSSTQTCGHVAFDSNGAIIKLVWNGTNYADPQYRLGLALYTEHAVNGAPGEGPTGWGDPTPKYLSFSALPRLISTSGDGCLVFTAKSTLDQNDTSSGPMLVGHTVEIKPETNSIVVTVAFANKAMSYNMYSSWADRTNYGNAVSVQFHPRGNLPWTVSTLGVEYSPNNFAANGTSHYHIADSVKYSNILSIRPLDTPLVMFGNNSASWFTNWDSPPDYSTGVWFNVFNQWNANKVIGWPWTPEVVKARYEISLLSETNAL